MIILGVSGFYHDSAAALIVDGEIVAAAQEERFTRKKHDPRFPINAILWCLEFADIDVNDCDYIAFYDKPFVKFERLLMTYVGVAPKGLRSFYQQIPPWLKQKLSMRTTIQKQLGYTGEVLFTNHHEAHAASAFFPSPFEEAAIVTLDGVGEWQSTTYSVGRGNKIEMLKEINFPHSLGLLYSAFTYFSGFKVNSGEYKLMGLAPYGEPTYVDRIKDYLIDIKDDGSYHLNMKYFDYCSGQRMTNDSFAKLFDGPARVPESKITQREMDLAKSIQVVIEDVVLLIAKHVYRITGLKNLCLAGGVALNCVANGKIIRQGPFENVWIQPAAGDAGSALGAALAIWHCMLGNQRTVDAAKIKLSWTRIYRRSDRTIFEGTRYSLRAGFRRRPVSPCRGHDCERTRSGLVSRENGIRPKGIGSTEYHWRCPLSRHAIDIEFEDKVSGIVQAIRTERSL
jgi:carbamoyltransferase